MSEMQLLNFTLCRSKRPGRASHSTTINKQLPIDGVKKMWGVLSNTGCHPHKDKWAEAKALALMVSATGDRQTLWLDGYHRLIMEVAD